ncbi:MAG: rhodanese-like domain-containing protein [Verrucomicrobia bacterium]|nr:rhodanese-like domain-containing protein [Verrucomicrobiota bacterium]
MDWKILIIVAVVVVAFFALKRMSFVSAEAARQHLAAGALVIDVRTAGEFNSGHVAKAVNIPLGELTARVPQIAKDKNQVLLVHCLSGGRSAIARQQLKRMGYANVFNLGSLGRARQIVEGNRD